MRTLIARQHLVEEIEAGLSTSGLSTSDATRQACKFSSETIRIYAKLRHLRLLRLWGFDAVSHITAAGHTLVACMGRSSDIAFEQRSNLLATIDLLSAISSRYPVAETAADLLTHLLRSIDSDTSTQDTAAIRILARKAEQRRLSLLPVPISSEPALTPNTAASLAELVGDPSFAWPQWGDSFHFLNDGLLAGLQ